MNDSDWLNILTSTLQHHVSRETINSYTLCKQPVSLQSIKIHSINLYNMKRYIVMDSVRNGVQVGITYKLTRLKLSKDTGNRVALHNTHYLH